MIILKKLSKHYGKNVIIKELDLEIPTTGLTCITGQSGAGKTTLLNLISLIEKPSTGTISFSGNHYDSPAELRKIRRRFGYMFQNYGLVDGDSVRQNLDLGTYFAHIPKKEKNTFYRRALEKVGLNANFLSKKVQTLSGGEQQRVALARIILAQPDYVFADEPTGNLDEENRNLVFDILKKVATDGIPVIYVSHDPFLIAQADFTIHL
ncbi:ABC transporter ATP-binding protein [Vagococcus salmoninarum]|uniref:ABC transporter domain-containing protein n=1 Tax=Vagococcus salmoninarum TaxID=2739 RepID=A0A429ZW48_9ENTE|nr:ATP-binding cassette domain-containing protein [Vagococcus salmoninarum]MBE9389009.1 ATP-binding cassette domain-containing protein [Vagococcus salmoninarum]RST97991.1 hypothetical protein CBF35_01490 [Vagococcus salmoninarum]